MNAIRLIFILVLSLPTMALSAQKNTGDENRSKRGLKPEQLQTIQAIGRSVLAAKHSQKKNPELKQLRQRVRELRQAVKEFNHINFSVEQGAVAIDSSDPKAMKSRTATKSRIQPKRHAAQGKLASALTKLRTHRVAMRDKRGKSAGGRDATLIANAMVKCEQLENEVEEFLASAPSEQSVKLKDLQDHLAPSKLLEVSRFQNDTPTISTITRHRK